MSGRTIVGGLDIGNTTIRACIGMIDDAARVHIVGTGISSADGVRRGAVVDESRFAAAVRSAVHHAERTSRVSAEEVVVGLGGSFSANVPPENDSFGAVPRAVIDAVRRLNVRVVDTVPTVVAAGSAVLTEEERAGGVVLVDIGASSTDIAVFRDGRAVQVAVVPVGGEHVTNDISYGLHVPVERAEQLKVRYGAAVPELVAGRLDPAAHHPKRELGLFDIVEPRVAELLELVAAALGETFHDEPPTTGIVLTGGTALLGGMQQAASRKLGAMVRIGVAHRALGPVEVVTSPVYAGSVGLLYLARRFDDDVPAKRGNGAPRGGLLESIKDWLSEFL